MWRRQWDLERDAEISAACALVTTEPSKTVQAPARDADLNVLVKRYGIDKMPVPVELMDPRYYADLSDAPDLRSALDRIREAEERFQALPAAVRRRFANSPVEFVEFLNDPANRPEAESMGLLRGARAPEATNTPQPIPNPQPTANVAPSAS